MPRQITEKKQYGVFYTPKRVAEILCKWAIRSTGDKILEPSFGGCDFLQCSRDRLIELGLRGTIAERRLYGSDIDKKAFNTLSAFLVNPNGHFRQDDFLSLSYQSFPVETGFDVVIGNPPYVSHHNMSAAQKKTAAEAVDDKNFNLDRRASLWAYFILHSLSFLKTGGRMAWILPSSVLYADYAKRIREILSTRFTRCLLINLHERLFLSHGTEEISVITLCEGLIDANAHPNIQMISATNISEISKVIEKWEKNTLKISLETKLSDGKANILFNQLCTHESTVELGDLYNIQIGIVSGANSFFILNKETWEKHNLSLEVATHILTKFRSAKGLSLEPTDFETILKTGVKCLLVDTTKTEKIEGSLKEFLDKFPEEAIKTATTFVRRTRSGVWHRFNDNRIPDAFFPYMQNKGTWIVINNAHINSTNSIHRLYRKEHVEEQRIKLSAISMLSTFSQLSAEIEGRTYGAGVLKHEPSEAVKIKILVPEVEASKLDDTFKSIDKLLRAGLHEQARQLSDQFLLERYSNDVKKSYSLFEKELINLQNERMPLKNPLRKQLYASKEQQR